MGKATSACFLLAERLLAAGRKTEAARLYTHLRDTRTDPSELHIREAASRRLHCRPNTFSAYFSEQLGAVREALGDAAFDTHYADGMGLSFDEATALALAIEHPDMAANSPRFDEVAS